MEGEIEKFQEVLVKGRRANGRGDRRPPDAFPHDPRSRRRRIDALPISLCRLEPASGNRPAHEDRSRQAAVRRKVGNEYTAG